MSADRLIVVLGLVIASALYAPVAIYLFGVAPGVMFERAYFVVAGGAAALFALK